MLINYSNNQSTKTKKDFYTG